MLLSSDAKGVFPIAPTPFFDDGSIDVSSIDRITDFYRRVRQHRHHGARAAWRSAEARARGSGRRWRRASGRARRCAAGGRRRVGAGLRGHARADARSDGTRRRRRDDRAAQHAAHRRSDRRLLPAGRRGDRRRRAVRAAGLSADFLGADDAGRDPPHRRRAAVVRDAQARRLARPRKDLDAARLRARRLDAAHRRSCAATAGCSSTSRWSAAPTARTPAIAFPTCCATWCA